MSDRKKLGGAESPWKEDFKWTVIVLDLLWPERMLMLSINTIFAGSNVRIGHLFCRPHVLSVLLSNN